MADRKYVLRKGIEGIIPSVFGESFHSYGDFEKRVRSLPEEAYLSWNVAMGFFDDLLKTNDNDIEKYLYKEYLLPITYNGIGKTSMMNRDYKVANCFMVVSFSKKDDERFMLALTKRQSQIKEEVPFSTSPGKYVLLLKEENPETIPERN